MLRRAGSGCGEGRDPHMVGGVAAGKSHWKSHVWKEQGFLLLLVLLCAVITVLQFKWTGELAEAEFERLESSQREGAEGFRTEVERELAEACKALTPDGKEMNVKSIQKAMAARVKRWRSSSPKPVFKRVGVVLTENDVPSLRLVDPVKGAVKEAEWPPEWEDLHADLFLRLEGAMGGFSKEGDGLLFEIPVFSPGGGGREAGWLVLELDREFLEKRFFPELVAVYFHAGLRDFFEIRVTDQSGRTVFSKGSGGDSATLLRLPMRVQDRGMMGPGGPGGGGGFGGGFGGGRPGDFERGPGAGPVGPLMRTPWWNLEVKRKSGELEKMVDKSRKRNLALAVAVNGLILLAGFALVRHTRRSRMLAEAQMDFVANVSHELRTPVTVIVGAAHNLKRGIVRTPEGVDRYAGMILQHADQLSEMVQEVLEFSAAKKGKAAYSMVPVDVGGILRQVLEEARAETGGLVVETSVPEKLPHVAGDAVALKRAFGNLIRNAAKHGGAGGWIGIKAEAAGGRKVTVEISDRGAGIPEEEQGAVFKPFFRGKKAKEQQVRGSGIGLGLVKEIVEAHDGTVSVCSEAGSGATFTVELPVVAKAGNESENSAGGG